MYVLFTLFVWIAASVFAGVMSMDRKAGFWVPFILALILSPVVGLIYGLESPRKSDIRYQEQMVEMQQQQLKLLQEIKKQLDGKNEKKEA